MSLSPPSPWRYYANGADTEATALSRLRTDYLGTGYSSATYSDARLTLALERAVRDIETYTQRVFAKVTGQVDLDGTGAVRLWLPQPVILTSQGGTGISGIVIGSGTNAETLVETDYIVNGGAGVPGDDPRDTPWIELSTEPGTYTRLSPMWPRGTQNIHITGTWGYVEASGATPELVREAVARMVVPRLAMLGSRSAAEASASGAIMQESTEGRSYQLSEALMSRGLTGDRVLDNALTRLRKPARQVAVSRATPRRATPHRRW